MKTVIFPEILDKNNIKHFYYLLKKKGYTLNLEKLQRVDYEGALFLYKLSKKHSLVNLNDNIKTLYDFIVSNAKNLKLPEQKNGFFYYLNDYIEKMYTAVIENGTNFLVFFGEFIYFLLYFLKNPWKFRFKETAAVIVKAGAGALPIVGLTSFLIGVVMAYQGAMQLSRFGADIFVVDMLDISVFREIAPLIAAIIVAGRSASAFSAEIGVMKLTEEIDAMRTLGFEPFWFLVMPRVAAMVIAMPLIVFFADLVSVFGGMLIAKLSLNIGFDMFLIRTKEVLSVTQVLIGLAKAPFFGLLIALIGTYRGFQVKNSTQDIGKYTTKSVVNAIFWVIALDALFSIILAKFGI